MDDKIVRHTIHRAMENCLSGVSVDPFLAQRVMIKGSERPANRKNRLSVVLVSLLIIFSVTALAIGIYDMVKPAMNQSAPLLLGDDSLKKKLDFVKVLRKYEIIEDGDEQLAVCMDSSASNDSREKAASILIERVYGDLIREDLDPTIVQQNEYLSPDLETVFAVFYRHIAPNASQATISAEFDKWFKESDLFEPHIVTQADSEAEPISETQMMERCEQGLSEIYNMNKSERDATQINLHFDEKNRLWVAQYTVKASALRPALKNEWGSDRYVVEHDSYEWTSIFLESGCSAGVSSVIDYEFIDLIPQHGYPDWEKWEDGYRGFLFCSAEERAKFSAIYKPIVDRFLQDHPELETYYRSTSDLNAVYITTRHVYGIPDELSINESQAIKTAINAWINSGAEGVWPEMLDHERSVYALYDITVPEKPLWKVSLSYTYEREPDPKANQDGYFVVLNARTGEIIKQYTQTGPNGANRDCHSATEFAETFL